MAQADSLSGAHRIRSLTDNDAIYHAFDAYPWTKDTAFLAGLAAILGEPSAASQHPQPSLPDIATHARIFYYTQRVGVQIDFTSYQAWLAHHPDHTPPNVIPSAYSSTHDQHQGPEPNDSDGASFALPWQQAAPKADLYIDRTNSAPGSAEPSYPMGFAEMLKLLQEGKPVPGIRQIPNTLARNPSVKPVGSRSAPRKPWEKSQASPSPEEMNLTKALDQEFPPLDTDAPKTPSEPPDVQV
ncbi:hypothetical protein CDD81_3320 [Ophiocordyceps australis]|uniref:Uncharacterized protein n=1 Tax=Ophiocordyceps australis TaxID=1399860 RepID=A0A2C5XAT8_9HYPO|nr:hypothetical protein CDD81_3320 [Ophiocordyceps australis]